MRSNNNIKNQKNFQYSAHKKSTLAKLEWKLGADLNKKGLTSPKCVFPTFLIIMFFHFYSLSKQTPDSLPKGDAIIVLSGPSNSPSRYTVFFSPPLQTQFYFSHSYCSMCFFFNWLIF